MDLFHYTALEYLHSIAREGLHKGDVSVTKRKLLNGVWLTTDPSPAGHGLTDGRELTAAEKIFLGRSPHAPIRFPDKRAVRFRVTIPETRDELVRWSTWGRRHLTPQWYRTLNETGGWKAGTWYVYFGIIPPHCLHDVFDLRSGVPLEGWPNSYLTYPSTPE